MRCVGLVKGNLMDRMKEYLKCTEIIDCDTKSIKEKAPFLTKGLKTAREKAIALFYFVRDDIKLNPYAPGYYLLEQHKASVTLAGSMSYYHKGRFFLEF